MPWPQTALPVRVRIAPGANPALPPQQWVPWVDVTNAVRVADGIDISDGRSNEAALVDAASMSLSLDARGVSGFNLADFNPLNPNGQWFGLLKRNTPIRVGVLTATDDFARSSASGWGVPTVSAVSACSWTVSGTATDWTVTGGTGQLTFPAANQARSSTLTGAEGSDSEGLFTASCPVLTTGASVAVGGMARRIDSTTYYTLRIEFDISSQIRLIIARIKANVSTTLANVVLPTPWTAGQLWRVRYQVIGSTLAMRAWPAAGGEPTTWQAGATDTVSMPGVGNGLYFLRNAANSNAGGLTLSVDDFSLEDIEFCGGITEFPLRWDESGRDSVVPLKASGIFRRLQQGSTPVKSPLLRQFTSITPLNQLWMMEDDAGATGAASSVPSATGMAATGVTFGAATDLPGSAQVARLDSAGSRLSGGVKTRLAAGATGFSVTGFLRFGSTPSSKSDFLFIGATGIVSTWVISFDATAVYVKGIYNDGTETIVTSGLYGLDPTKWWAWSFHTTVSAGTLTWFLYAHQIGTGNGFNYSTGSYSTTVVPSAVSVTMLAAAPMAGCFVGPVRVGENTFPFVTQSFRNVAAGWFGELASARIARLCSEAGVPCYVEEGTSEPMGVQRSDALFPLLRTCEAADYGVLYEAGFGIAYRPRINRYSRKPVLVLDQASGHVASPPEPTYDDQALRNDVTVSRDGGAQSVRSFDQTSIDGEGVYDDSATLNVATDDALPHHAGWRVFLGTRPELRWSSIALDLMRNTSIIAAWRSRVFGDRMTIANAPAQVAGNSPDVIIEGTTQRLSAYSWAASVNTSPARPWDVANLDDTVLRMDTAGSTIGTAPSPATTGTSFTVATTSGPLWVTTAANPAEFPFTITVAGEDMTVTAITGTSSPQTFTVTRSVNSVTKAQVAGADVRLKTPMILAL